MKNRTRKTLLSLLLALTMLTATACSSKGDGGTTTKAPQDESTQAESTEETTKAK